jgi:hypothetical protein
MIQEVIMDIPAIPIPITEEMLRPFPTCYVVPYRAERGVITLRPKECRTYKGECFLKIIKGSASLSNPNNGLPTNIKPDSFIVDFIFSIMAEADGCTFSLSRPQLE